MIKQAVSDSQDVVPLVLPDPPVLDVPAEPVARDPQVSLDDFASGVFKEFGLELTTAWVAQEHRLDQFLDTAAAFRDRLVQFASRIVL